MSNQTNTRYHPLQVSLHWLTVILIFAAFLLGKYMSGLPNESEKIPFLAIHMALGILTLIVIITRVIARFRIPRPTPASAGNPFFDLVGKIVHYALYILVFLMTLSGMSLSIQSGLMPIVFGGSNTPLPVDFYDFTARVSHGIIAPTLLIMVVLHIGAALYHQLTLKDKLLSRMWYRKESI